MPRKLFTLAAAVSAVLCAGVCVLWVVSYGASGLPPCTRQLKGFNHWCWLSRGRFSYEITADLPLPPPGGLELQTWADSRPIARREGLGFEYERGEYVGYEAATENVIWPYKYQKFRRFGIPAYAIVLPLASVTLGCCLGRARGQARLEAGLCASCGYDLRATPDRCPECGAAATTGVAT